jgi:hypothetical protein
MVTGRSLPTSSCGELTKVTTLNIEYKHSARRSENDKVSFPVCLVVKTPPDNPFVTQSGQLLSNDEFRGGTTIDWFLVDPPGHFSNFLGKEIWKILAKIRIISKAA